jgi:hypothetical protein
MTDERLREIEERCNKAIEGPWVSDKDYDITIYKGPVKKKSCSITHKGEICKMDDLDCSDFSKSKLNNTAKFIAAARQDIPDLLAYIAELQGALKKLYYAHGLLEVEEMSPEEFDEIASNLLKVADGK